MTNYSKVILLIFDKEKKFSIVFHQNCLISLLIIDKV